jgi:hypothetical protein
MAALAAVFDEVEVGVAFVGLGAYKAHHVV